MKKIIKMLSLTLMSVVYLNANPILQEENKDGFKIELKTEKSLFVGSNEMLVKITKDNKEVSDVNVKMKVFMPEMPGMPSMEEESKGNLVNGVYKLNVNFSMNGTWQYQLKFKTKDEIVHTIKGSLNI